MDFNKAFLAEELPHCPKDIRAYFEYRHNLGLS